MRAFVTGGSGFLGRALIAALRRQGHQARGLARSDAAAESVRVAGAEVVRGDLDNQEAMRAGMSGCDVVFHAAALAKDWGDPAEFHRVNVAGTENVIAAARAAGVPRLVHVSTEAVLVNGAPLRNVDETYPRPAQPVGLYPRTKALAEERVLAAASPQLQTIVVRPRFIWGKGDTSLLPQIAEAVRAGKFMWISGGRHLTSTCNVENVCEGTIKAAERGRSGEIYFLTDGPPVESRSFLTALLKTKGIDPGTKSLPRWLVYLFAAASEGIYRLFSLKGAPPITRTAVLLIGDEVTVKDDKARRELGYAAAVSREAGLAAMTE
jgi:nucleoside-diphosphate-sugar epimerase